MMIESYFTQLENIFQDFPLIRSYTLSKKRYNAKQGFIRGTVIFKEPIQAR